MPRKFLGERINPFEDAVRPPSQLLTVDDLMNIPIFDDKIDDELKLVKDEDMIIDKRSKRLSRKFGGTINLKKRLESVPEIFLRDFKQRSQLKNREQISLNRNNDGKHKKSSASKRDITPKALQEKRILQRINSQRTMTNLPKLVEDLSISKQQQEAKQSYVNSNKSYLKNETLNESKLTIEESITDGNSVGKTSSEILFDEIVACYGLNNNSMNEFTKLSHNYAFNEELERVLNHVNKMDNIDKIGTFTTGIKRPFHTPIQSLDSKLLTPPYSDLSERSPLISDSAEFSDIVSSDNNTSSQYTTANEDWGSVNDLDIAKTPQTLVTQPTIPISYKKSNTFERRNLKKVDVNPLLAHMNYDEDEDENAYKQTSENYHVWRPQSSIQKKHLTRNPTILSASSSCYSTKPNQ